MNKSLERELFPDEGTFLRIYSEHMEKEPQASEKTRSAYQEVTDRFDWYLDAVLEDMFRYAYQCGYEAAAKSRNRDGQDPSMPESAEKVL